MIKTFELAVLACLMAAVTATQNHPQVHFSSKRSVAMSTPGFASAHSLDMLLSRVGNRSALLESSGTTNPTLAPDCVSHSPMVWFASSTGSDGSDGKSPQTPKTMYGAATLTQPGSIVCVLGGTYPETHTFYPPHLGTPAAWIVYKAYGDGPVNFVWTSSQACPPADCTMANAYNAGGAYIEYQGFNFYGEGLAGNALGCNNSHHLRFIGNTIYNVTGAGVGAVQCDYVTSDHNIVYHNGYAPTEASWTSGISYNQIKASDCNDGLHNVISNNMVVGQHDNSAHHTDGNGFILDIDSTPRACAQTAAPYEPTALVINNVAYGNGGRCAQVDEVSFFWIVMNNTCYKNDLDDIFQPNGGSITVRSASNGYIVNNISVGWKASNPPYNQLNTSSNIQYFNNLYWGGPCSLDPMGIDFCTGSPHFINGDAKFVAPPFFDTNSQGSFATAEPPFVLANGLALQSDSPAACQGIDPSKLAGVPAQVANDMQNSNNVYYVYQDLHGNMRHSPGCWHLGAYQRRGGDN
jgi:hypothetical protein